MDAVKLRKDTALRKKRGVFGSCSIFAKRYNIKMNKIHFTSVVWKERKYYVAQCLNVDVSSFGKTKKEAVGNLEEALELYLEDAPVKKVPRIGSPAIVVRELAHA